MKALEIALATAILVGAVTTLASAEPSEQFPANLSEHRSRIEGLDHTSAELREVRARVIDLEMKRAKQRQQRYPRGEAKADLENAWRQAVAEQTRLERRWADLLEKARREGVPPGTLRHYRNLDGSS